MPGAVSNPFLQLDVVLEVDTLVIDAVEIYPWKSYEEFKEAFVNLKLPTDDMERARRNIALLRTQIIMDHDPDAYANFQKYNGTTVSSDLFSEYESKLADFKSLCLGKIF